MVRRFLAVLGIAGGLVAGAGAWTLYQRATTDEAPYTVVDRLGDGVELRRYPSSVVIETVAPTENEAFRRLFRYISGTNAGDVDIAMTTPVEVSGLRVSLPMTAPVEVRLGRPTSKTGRDGPDDRDDTVRMAFYLPTGYDIEAAPTPTDETVALRSVPERTLAVRRFSGRPSDVRIAREEGQLQSTLESADIAVSGKPFFLGYDAPWTLPFLRRNEVAVELSTGV